MFIRRDFDRIEMYVGHRCRELADFRVDIVAEH